MGKKLTLQVDAEACERFEALGGGVGEARGEAEVGELDPEQRGCEPLQGRPFVLRVRRQQHRRPAREGPVRHAGVVH